MAKAQSVMQLARRKASKTKEGCHVDHHSADSSDSSRTGSLRYLGSHAGEIGRKTVQLEPVIGDPMSIMMIVLVVLILEVAICCLPWEK